MTEMQMPAIPRSQTVFGSLVYWVTILAAIICIVGPLVAFIEINSNVINPHYEMKNIFDGMKPDFNLQNLQEDVTAGTTFLVVEDGAKFDDPDDVGRDVVIRITGQDGAGELATILAINKDANVLELEKPLVNSYAAQQAEVGEITVWNARGTVTLTSDAQVNTDSLVLSNVERIEEPTADRPIAIMIEDEDNREQVFVDYIDKGSNTVHLTDALRNSYSVASNATVTQITPPKEIEGHFWIDNLTNGDGLTQLGLVIGCAVGVPAMGGAALILITKEKAWGWALAALGIVLLIIISAVGLV